MVTKEVHVLNLGAGVQSTAVYLLNIDGVITPRFDYAIFADTQEEPSAVYDHIAWLRSTGGAPILARSVGKLGEDLKYGRNSTGHRFASIPAFSAPVERSGKVREGRVRRQCTREYKISPIEATIRRDILGRRPRQRVPRGVVVYQYYGISVDERRRSVKIRQRCEKSYWQRPVFPLLDLDWTRADCLRYLESRVPHPVPKSACVFCPYRTNDQWLWLISEDPAGWKRAVEIDEALRDTRNIVTRHLHQRLYLHRSCQPLTVVNFHGDGRERVDPLTVNECEGMCGV